MRCGPGSKVWPRQPALPLPRTPLAVVGQLDAMVKASPLRRSLVDTELLERAAAAEEDGEGAAGDVQPALSATADGPQASSLDAYHVVVTADDSISMAWQTQLAYHWYLQAKEAHPEVPMGGFTRVLHRWVGEWVRW